MAVGCLYTVAFQALLAVLLWQIGVNGAATTLAAERSGGPLLDDVASPDIHGSTEDQETSTRPLPVVDHSAIVKHFGDKYYSTEERAVQAMLQKGGGIVSNRKLLKNAVWLLFFSVILDIIFRVYVYPLAFKAQKAYSNQYPGRRPLEKELVLPVTIMASYPITFLFVVSGLGFVYNLFAICYDILKVILFEVDRMY